MGQHVMKAVDVSIESASSASERYDAFCIQNEGKLCGDPPSFPHTILHGHNEFEMGDELLYVCAQGYIMGNREAAFTLLCNTCGEWYGHVQACVKDDTLTHIDYEDNFPDDRTMSVTEPEDEDGEEDVEEEEFPFDGDTAVKTGQEDAHGIFDSIETESRASTESPVSRLSQEHLFWFPSDALTQPQGERELDGGIKTHFADGTNHIGVKTDFSEPGTKMVFDSEDFPLESFLENNDTKTIKDPVASTDESWLDGYPVTEDAAEDGEKTDGSIEVDEEIVLATDEPNYVDIKKTGVTTPVPERDTSQIAAAPTKLLDYGIKGAQVPLTPVSAPENVSTSKGVDDIVGFRPTTQMDFSFEESVTTTVLYDVLEGLPTSILETLATVRPIDHILAPTEADESTTYLNPEDTNGSSAGDTGAFTDASSSEEVLRRATLANELEGGLISTSQPCSKENCPDSSQGPLIAVIVTVLCLLILAILLAMWCYKKRQQKSSVYKMNGKGQTRHPQQIEMQDV